MDGQTDRRTEQNVSGFANTTSPQQTSSFTAQHVRHISAQLSSLRLHVKYRHLANLKY